MSSLSEFSSQTASRQISVPGSIAQVLRCSSELMIEDEERLTSGRNRKLS